MEVLLRLNYICYAVYSYLSIMQCDLPKEKLHEGETSTTTKTYIDLTKEILFMLGHKKKHL